MLDDLGNTKYKKLAALSLNVLKLSHGNADPKRGFSINKNLIEIYSISIGNDRLQAIHLIKGYIMWKGGYINILPLSPPILKAVWKSHSAFLEHKKQIGEKEKEDIKQAIEKSKQSQESKDKKMHNQKIESEIGMQKTMIS